MYVVTAGTKAEAEQRFQAFLDGLHEAKTVKAKRHRSIDLQREHYTLFELPREAGVTPLALWEI